MITNFLENRINHYQSLIEEFELKATHAIYHPEEYNETDYNWYKKRASYYMGKRDELVTMVDEFGYELLCYTTFTGSTIWAINC